MGRARIPTTDEARPFLFAKARARFLSDVLPRTEAVDAVHLRRCALPNGSPTMALNNEVF